MPQRTSRDRLVAIHPGEFLREDFMKPLALSMNALGLALRVPTTRISEIVNERRGITADTAIRLGIYFGTSPDFWMNMQKSYELAVAEDTLRMKIHREVQPRSKVGTQNSTRMKRSA
jgi:addiction module HigA family antidote